MNACVSVVLGVVVGTMNACVSVVLGVVICQSNGRYVVSIFHSNIPHKHTHALGKYNKLSKAKLFNLSCK